MRRLLGPTVLVAAVAGWTGCWRWLAPERHGVRLDADLATLITGLAAWLLLAALAWLVLLVALTVLEPYVARRGRDVGLAAAAGCPAWLRPVLLTICGVATVGALATPVGAYGDGGTTAAVIGTSGIADGLPVPDRVSDDALPRGAPPASAWVVVEPGDSLWSITRQQLGRSASAARIEAGWRRLYERNRARIGDDPDLIEPGTRLHLDRREGRQP